MRPHDSDSRPDVAPIFDAPEAWLVPELRAFAQRRASTAGSNAPAGATRPLRLGWLPPRRRFVRLRPANDTLGPDAA